MWKSLLDSFWNVSGSWKLCGKGQVRTGQVRIGQVKKSHVGTGSVETGEVSTGQVMNRSSWDRSIPEGLGQTTGWVKKTDPLIVGCSVNTCWAFLLCISGEKLVVKLFWEPNSSWDIAFLVHGRHFQIKANSNHQIVKIFSTETDWKSTKINKKNLICFYNWIFMGDYWMEDLIWISFLS